MFAMCVIAATFVTGINAVSCPSGDTAGVVRDGMTCVELIDARNYECYDSGIETQCCESCNNLTLTLVGTSSDCLYGDRQSGCFSFACSSLVNISDCCHTCTTTSTTTSTTTTSSTTSSTPSSTTSSTTSTTSSTTSSTSSSTSTTSTSTSTTAPMTSLPLMYTSTGVPGTPSFSTVSGLSLNQTSSIPTTSPVPVVTSAVTSATARTNLVVTTFSVGSSTTAPIPLMSTHLTTATTSPSSILTSFSASSQARSSSSSLSLSGLFTAATNTTSSTSSSSTVSFTAASSMVTSASSSVRALSENSSVLPSVASSKVTSVSSSARATSEITSVLPSTQSMQSTDASSSALPMQPATGDNAAAIVGGVIGGLAGLLLIVAAICFAIKLKKCCKRKVSTTNRSIIRSNKKPLISGNHFASGPDSHFINMTLGSGQPYSLVTKVTNENNINKGFKDEPENKVSETNPPLHNKEANTMSATPIVKFDMPNYATEFDELNETLTTQEISYLITIDPPSLVELDVSHSEEDDVNGNQDDLDNHETELRWEVTSYVNEPEKDPETQGTGNQNDINKHDTQLHWDVTSYVNESENDPETQATINREDLVNHVTEIHWEVTSYINEPEHAPEAQVIGEFEIVDVNYNET